MLQVIDVALVRIVLHDKELGFCGIVDIVHNLLDCGVSCCVGPATTGPCKIIVRPVSWSRIDCRCSSCHKEYSLNHVSKLSSQVLSPPLIYKYIALLPFNMCYSYSLAEFSIHYQEPKAPPRC